MGVKLGIGTGWSTSIPCYNPISIIDYIIKYLNEDELQNFIHIIKDLMVLLKRKVNMYMRVKDYL